MTHAPSLRASVVLSLSFLFISSAAYAQTTAPYELTIDVTLGGRVTAAGIDCGPSTNDCSEQFPASGPVWLQATPSAGYRFIGWTGSCDGGAYTSIEITESHNCAAVFAALDAGSFPQDPRLSANALFLHSYPGGPGGKGRFLILNGIEAYDTGGGCVEVLTCTGERTKLSVTGRRSADRELRLTFMSPVGRTFVPGVYAPAGGWDDRPGIDISEGFEPFCFAETNIGRFIIHEITYASPPSIAVTALALDFEYRCTPASPPLLGSIRLNSRREEIRPFAPALRPSGRFDLNSDGATDLLWQNRDDGRLMFWHMSWTSHIFNEPLVPAQVGDTNWHVVGNGDANRDGYTDLYWHHQTTGELAIWYMRGHTLVSGEPLMPPSVPDTNWKVRTVADINRDGYPDLIWQHVGTGDVAVWFMRDRRQVSGRLIGPGPVTDLSWTIVGTGDMNRDGWTDLLWHNVGTGQLSVWLMAGATMLSGELLSPSAVPDTDWRVRGVADIDRNGYPDLLWQHLSTLDVAVWFMHGRQLIDGRLVVGPALLDPAWHLVSPK